MAPMPPHAGYPQPTPQWGHPSAPQGGMPPPAAMYPPAGAYPPTMPPAYVPPTVQPVAQVLSNTMHGLCMILYSQSY